MKITTDIVQASELLVLGAVQKPHDSVLAHLRLPHSPL